jgi:hypothetical protein
MTCLQNCLASTVPSPRRGKSHLNIQAATWKPICWPPPDLHALRSTMTARNDRQSVVVIDNRLPHSHAGRLNHAATIIVKRESFSLNPSRQSVYLWINLPGGGVRGIHEVCTFRIPEGEQAPVKVTVTFVQVCPHRLPATSQQCCSGN